VTDPVPVRDAATVVLLRDGATGLDVWLLTRVTQMVFAAGMSVFAGEGVATVAERFGCSEATARALLGGAVRETFEETGVLLTSPVADLTEFRADVEAGRVEFGDLLRDHRLAVDATALRPWARWVTPKEEVRRYDTRFFVGAMPTDAEAQDVTSESSMAEWVPVADAIGQMQRGERLLLPPTRRTLESLLPFATVAEALAGAAHRPVDAIRPTLTRTDDGRVLARMPDGSEVEIPKAMLR
jgi:8-oxo-dGTP pyrophosphatase MutT (NUDIX family)